MTGQPFRLASGGLIDRTATLAFTFDGKAYAGHPGDTLASALLANGVRLFGRSFKYHRPRGVLTAGSEEPNALVTVGEGARATPNTRATDVFVYAGLVARSQADDDLRVRHVRLTDAGRAMIERVLAVHAEEIQTIMSGLTAQEQATLARLLDQLDAHLKTLNANAGGARRVQGAPTLKR